MFRLNIALQLCFFMWLDGCKLEKKEWVWSNCLGKEKRGRVEGVKALVEADLSVPTVTTIPGY